MMELHLRNVIDMATPLPLVAPFILSYLSLSLTPSFIPLILLLTALLLHSQDKRHHKLKATGLWTVLTASISLSHLGPSIHALSTPSTSILSLVLLSGLSSAVALVPIYSSHRLESAHGIVFPSLWATTWLVVSWVSPVGRLITWTPLSGVSAYRWVTQYLGFAGLDWITAAWAIVATKFLRETILVPQKEEDLIRFEQNETREPENFKFPPITSLLLALAIPSFFINPLPLPPLSPSTTPLRVACILPEVSELSQLDRFLSETKSYANSAKVLLWPESAVTFETQADMKLALHKVEEISKASKVWIGVSFEERVSGSMRDGLRRNGMALVGPEGVEMTYYKRMLVPIAESFSQIASKETPPIHDIELPRPPHWRGGDWGSSETRTIPLSASICLDFSAPLTSLESRPALVLAPAKTWHIGVGRGMYKLAQARGDEIGADVLWCDGGGGGISGVAGNTHTGTGSWVDVIGVPHPFDDKRTRTVYGAGGDWLALAVVLGMPAIIIAAQRNMLQLEERKDLAIAWTRQLARRIVDRVRGRNAIAPAEQNERLIDDGQQGSEQLING